MLPFELTAIDSILVIAVIILLILHMKKNNSPEEFVKSRIRKEKQKARNSVTDCNNKTTDIKYTECPRGFGKIKIIGKNNTVSERCLSCYRLMDCYGEGKGLKDQHIFNQ